MNLQYVEKSLMISQMSFDPPALVLSHFQFLFRLGGDGGQISSLKPDSIYLFNFSSIIFFSNKSLPPKDSLWGVTLFCEMILVFFLFFM